MNPDLETVFELCQPRKVDRKISLSKLQQLFEEHTTGAQYQHQQHASPVGTDHGKFLSLDCSSRTSSSSSSPLSSAATSDTDDWISFDEFSDAISNLIDCKLREEEAAYDRLKGEESDTRDLGNTYPESLIPDLSAPDSPDPRRSKESSHQQHLLDGDDFLCSLEDNSAVLNSLNHIEQQTSLIDLLTDSSTSHSLTCSDRLNLSSSSLQTVMNSPKDQQDASTNEQHEPPLAGAGSPSASLADSGLGGLTSPDNQGKSHCSSLSDREEESYEGCGDNEDTAYESEFVEMEYADSSSSAARTAEPISPVPEKAFVRGPNWLRTSLRKSPANAEHHVPPKRWGSFRHSKRVGSNAIAGVLFQNQSSGNGAPPSFNSSGRSSNCDEADLQSDVSIEDGVFELNEKNAANSSSASASVLNSSVVSKSSSSFLEA